MNNLKSKAGFTLVELIVVIAILAILAGVGTAAYSGYIAKAHEAADYAQLDAVKTAVLAVNATSTTPVLGIKVTETDGNTPATVVLGELEDEAVVYDDNNVATNDDFKTYMNVASGSVFKITLNSGSTATWDGSTWTIAN